MSLVYITRRESFSASHRLFNPALSEETNLALYGKCANANGHGHNYVLEVTVAGEPQADSGYVIDLKTLKELIRKEVIEKVDHKHLNLDVDFLRETIPTAENIAMACWRLLHPKITEGMLFSVRLHETENNIVEYRGE